MKYAGKTKEKIIEAEKRKFAEIFKEMDVKTKKSVGSLIDQAAFMGASLYQLAEAINEKGYTEVYQNGANQKGIKKSSEVEIYNVMIKNYSSIIKQLTDLLPKEAVPAQNTIMDDFDQFLNEKNT